MLTALLPSGTSESSSIEILQDLVGENLLVPPIGRTEDTIERVGFVRSISRIARASRRADVRGRLSNVTPVAICRVSRSGESREINRIDVAIEARRRPTSPHPTHPTIA